MTVVISIALGPVGGLFATGSGDQKSRIWRVSRRAGSTEKPCLIGEAARGQSKNNGGMKNDE